MKILIISYHYPPCNAVAALRPKSFADNWSVNHDVKVITRKWEGNEKIPKDYLASNEGEVIKKYVHENLEEIYLPFKKRDVTTKEVAIGLIKGNLTIDFETNQFKEFGAELCTTWKPDIIFVTSPPINILKLGKELSDISKSKLVADFRDFENHYIFGGVKLSFKNTIISKSTIYHTHKWLNYCDLVTCVSEPFTEYFSKLNCKKVITVLNGFEKSLFDDLSTEKVFNSKFEISLIGTIYDEQDPSVILEGIKLFIENKQDVFINFIGTNKGLQINDQITAILPPSKLLITSRIPRKDALNYMKNASILFYVGWPGYKGMYSGKIFEYLGARKTILIAPSDNDVLDKLIEETKSGVSVNTSNEVALFLEEKYNEWKKTGTLEYHGIEDKIMSFSRENQAKLLEQELIKLIDFKESQNI